MNFHNTRNCFVSLPCLTGMAVAACVCALGFPALAQETEIPIPKPGKATAVKGDAMSIELSAITRTRASTVEFLVRDHPLSGKLGVLVSNPKDRTRAMVTYTADRGTAADTDFFTFAVRYYPGGRYSKEVKVEIDLVESEPFIVVTGEADFSKVMLGDSKEKEIFLQNTGQAAFQRKLELPEPWSISEPRDGFVNLPMGGGRSIKVRFTPIAEGSLEHSFTLNPNPGGACRLVGTGFAPFEVKTPVVSLTWEKNSRARIGEIQLDVNSPKVMPIAIRPTDQRLLVDGGINQMIVPGKLFATRVYLPATDSQAYSGTVEIVAGNFRLPISVAASVTPAYIDVDTGGPASEQVIDFGTLEPASVTQKGFVVRNVGGQETKIRFVADEPFQILAAGGGSTLSSGESEAFAIRFRAPEGKQYVFDEVLKITAESGQMLQVRLIAAVRTPDGVAPNFPGPFATLSPGHPTPAGNSDQPPKLSNNVPKGDRPPDALANVVPGPITDRNQLDELRSPLGFVTVPLVEREISPDIPPVPEVGMTFENHGVHHVTVAWDLPRKHLTQFELERRGRRENKMNLVQENVWAPYHDVEYKLQDGRMFATIRGLNPNELCEFRVFTLGNDGKVSKPVAFVSDTKGLRDWTGIYITLAVLLAAAIGAIYWRWYTARKIGSEELI